MVDRYTVKVVVLSPSSMLLTEQMDFGIPRNNVTNGVGVYLMNAYMLEKMKCSEHHQWICENEKGRTRYEMYWGHNVIDNFNPTAFKLVSRTNKKTCRGNCYIVKSIFLESVDSRVYVDTDVNEFVNCFNEHNKSQIVRNTNGTYELKSMVCCGIV